MFKQRVWHQRIWIWGFLVPRALAEAWDGGSPGERTWLMNDLLWRGTIEKTLEFSWVSTLVTWKTKLQPPANAYHSLCFLQHRSVIGNMTADLCILLSYFPEWPLPLLCFSPPSWKTPVIKSLFQGLYPMLCHFLCETFWFHWCYGMCVCLPPIAFWL